MDGHPTSADALAVFLTQHQHAIAAIWARRAQQLAAPPYATVSFERLERWAQQGLSAIIATLRTDSSAAFEGYLHELSRYHRQRGFELGATLDVLLLCKEAVAAVLDEAPDPAVYRALPRLDVCLRRAVHQVGELYAATIHQYLREQQQRADLMLDAAHMVSSASDLDLALSQIAEGIATAVGGCCCAIYLLDQEQDMLLPRALSRPLPTDQHGTFYERPVIVANDPVATLALQQRGPLVTPADSADVSPADHTILGQLGYPVTLLLPLLANGRVLGLAVVASTEQGRTARPDQVDLAWGLTRALALAVENAQFSAEIWQRLAESQSLQHVTSALLQKLSLTEVLEVVCGEALSITGAQCSAVLLLEDDTRLRVAHSVGTLAPIHESLSVGGSLTGLAVQHRAPVLSNEPNGPDPAHDMAWYHPWGAPTAFLSAPLCVQDTVFGAIDLVNKPGGFTADDLRLVRLLADQAAIAIEHTRLYQQLEHLAVVAERERLAHDLHDSVTQALYSLTLYSAASLKALAEGDQPTTRRYLHDVETIAYDALREMRLLIFNLRPPVLEQEGLAGALQRRLDSVESRAGLQATLRIEGTEQPGRPVQAALYYITQEALTNVLRHAAAQHVTVSLQFGAAHTRLKVCDDGAGFDLSLLNNTGGLGIRGMRERVAALGGTLTLHSTPGQGTTLEVEVPQ